MKRAIYSFILIISTLNLNACQLLLSPTTYSCLDINETYEYRNKPIGEPGMTHEEFRHAFENSQLSLTYDDAKESLVYLKYDDCPIWRYRFDKGRVVARGYLVQEMGFWGYVDINYEETIITRNAILDDKFNLIGVRVRKMEPVYNAQGELIGVKETWFDEMNQNH